MTGTPALSSSSSRAGAGDSWHRGELARGRHPGGAVVAAAALGPCCPASCWEELGFARWAKPRVALGSPAELAYRAPKQSACPTFHPPWYLERGWGLRPLSTCGLPCEMHWAGSAVAECRPFTAGAVPSAAHETPCAPPPLQQNTKRSSTPSILACSHLLAGMASIGVGLHQSSLCYRCHPRSGWSTPITSLLPMPSPPARGSRQSGATSPTILPRHPAGAMSSPAPGTPFAPPLAWHAAPQSVPASR